MEVVPEQRPFIDLVQIRCPKTPSDPGSFGSGWLVSPGIVLTALHCVAIAGKGWIDRELIEIYPWRDLLANAPTRYTAKVVWPPSDRKDPADIAVLEIQEHDAPEPLLAAVFCELPDGEFRGETVGFPRAAAGSALTGGRIEHREYGNSFLSNEARRTLRFHSTGETELAGKDAWSGLSGGPLRCEGAIVGVMREVPDRWDGHSVLEAEPLPALLRDRVKSRDLRRWLGLRGPLPPAPLPAAAAPVPPARPAFKADPAFSRLLELLYTLDRLDEVDEALPQIGQHVGNRTVEVLVAGRPEDRCNDFYFRLWHVVLQETALAGDTDGAGLITTPQPNPPAPIAWPATDLGPDVALSALARRGLNSLARPSGFSPSLAQLREELEKPTITLPFLALSLPRPPTQYDLSLLEEWRRAWRGIARARLPKQFVGYALLYSASDMPSEALRLPPDTELGQVMVRLRELNEEHIRAWPDQLRALEGQRPPGSPGAPLYTIAQDVLNWIDQYEVHVLRLETVSRLLLGEPDWYRATS